MAYKPNPALREHPWLMGWDLDGPTPVTVSSMGTVSVWDKRAQEQREHTAVVFVEIPSKTLVLSGARAVAAARAGLRPGARCILVPRDTKRGGVENRTIDIAPATPAPEGKPNAKNQTNPRQAPERSAGAQTRTAAGADAGQPPQALHGAGNAGGAGGRLEE